jgi:hypothetical protein
VQSTWPETYSPTDGLTVVRDAEFGVPHIFGETRAAAMFGAGYVAAEDRLFLMDILRHLGRGRMSELLGASDGNRAMDREQLRVAALHRRGAHRTGAGPVRRRRGGGGDLRGRGRLHRGRQRVHGRGPPGSLPPAGGVPGAAGDAGGLDQRGHRRDRQPRRWDLRPGRRWRDRQSRFLAQLQAEHGQAEGAAVFADFRSANDPEAPPTTGRAFPYNNHTTIDPASTAILDLDTVDATMAAMAPPSMVADGPFGPIDLRGLADPVRMSNAILATGDVTDGGVPIAVFGPQTGYFTPQLLVEMGIFGPGIAARGAAFAGTNLFIQLGRGTNYAWSATSAGGDNVDQWVLELCEPDGSDPSTDSQHYVYNGECREMDVFTQSYFAKPTAGPPRRSAARCSCSTRCGSAPRRRPRAS